MKFESTKSLASTSSRSIGAALSENGDKDAPANTLSFIIEEQQKCCDFNIEGGPPQKIADEENYVTLNQLNKQNISYAAEICLVTPIDVETESCSNIGEHPVDICSVSVLEPNLDAPSPTEKKDCAEKLGTNEGIESRIPRLRNLPSKIPVSPAKAAKNTQNGVKDNYKAVRSKIPHNKVSCLCNKTQQSVNNLR